MMSRVEQSEIEQALAATELPLSDARQLPRWAFVSTQAFEMDLALFDANASPLCHVSDLKQPGDYLSRDWLGEPLLMTFGADLVRRALMGRCPHRGTALLQPGTGRAPSLLMRCPYHGLTFDLSGRCLDAERLGLHRDVALPALRTTEQHGFVFRSPSEATDKLVSDAPPWIRQANLSALVPAYRERADVACNWKLLVQNFQESHHFPWVHPGLEARTPWRESESQSHGTHWLTGVMPMDEAAQTVSESRLFNGRPLIVAPEEQRVVRDALFLPGWLTSLQPDYLLSYSLVPREPAATTIEFGIFVHPSAAPESYEDLVSFWQRTNQEDREICLLQQRGVGGHSYRPSGYAASEDGVHAFDRSMAEHYRQLLAAGEPQ